MYSKKTIKIKHSKCINKSLIDITAKSTNQTKDQIKRAKILTSKFFPRAKS